MRETLLRGLRYLGVLVRLAGDDLSYRCLNIGGHPPEHFEAVGWQHQDREAAALEVLLISQVLVGCQPICWTMLTSQSGNHSTRSSGRHSSTSILNDGLRPTTSH